MHLALIFKFPHLIINVEKTNQIHNRNINFPNRSHLILTSSKRVGSLTLTFDFALYHFTILVAVVMIKNAKRINRDYLLKRIRTTMRLFPVTIHITIISQDTSQ